MNDRWRQYKSKITKKIKEANLKPQRTRAFKSIKPNNITNDEEWKKFVKERTSTEFEVSSTLSIQN